MNKYILILFLITTHLFASSQVNLVEVKMKAKQVNNIVKAKILITGDFRVPSVLKNNENYFITRVMATIDGDIVYDISLSHTFQSSRRLQFVLKFNFLYKGRGNTLTFTLTDNKGKQFQYNIKIKNSLGKNDKLNSQTKIFKPIDYRKENPKLWEYTNTNKAIKALYGISKGTSNVININLDEYDSSLRAYHVRFNIHSKIKMKTIAIFSDDLTNFPDRKKSPSIRAIISLPENTTVDFLSFNILTLGTCCVDWSVPITIVGVDKDGHVYQTVMDATLYCSADCET